MVKWQGLSRRKPSGGRLHWNRPKKKFELGRTPALTKIYDERSKKVRVRGGHLKTVLFSTRKITFIDKRTGKAFKSEMLEVEENSASRHFKRANIVTKGAIVKAKDGYIKVTNRPGQDGCVQGILLPTYESAVKKYEKKGHILEEKPKVEDKKKKEGILSKIARKRNI